jgi:hypothetical protein
MNVEFPSWGWRLGGAKRFTVWYLGTDDWAEYSKARASGWGRIREATLQRGCQAHNQAKLYLYMAVVQSGLLHGAETLFVSKRPMKRL